MHKAGILLNICKSEVGTLYRFLAFFFLSLHFRSVMKSICVAFLFEYMHFRRGHDIDSTLYSICIRAICIAFSSLFMHFRGEHVSTMLYKFSLEFFLYRLWDLDYSSSLCLISRLPSLFTFVSL